MNKFKLYFTLSFISIALFSCKKDDDLESVPLRDYAVQKAADNAAIETYMKTHYITQVEIDGMSDVRIDTLKASDPQGHVSIWDDTTFPKQVKQIQSDTRTSNLVDGEVKDTEIYNLYYVILNEGQGDKPTVVDSVYTTYRGWKLNNEEFDRNTFGMWSTFPALSTAESQLISGYRQFVPYLKAAMGSTTAPDGTITYNNPGTGIVFIPSGLGYYNTSRVGIPAYSPLVFVVRLNNVRYRDHDRDGVLDINEDVNGNGNFFDDDTDGDNIPNFLDVDDDNDGFLTKTEIKDATTGIRYPFEQIPACGTGTLKRHLDASCH